MNYDQLSLIWSGLFWSSTITICFFTLYMDMLFKQVCIRCKYLYDSIDIYVYIYMYICTYVLMIKWTSIYIYSSLWAYIYIYVYTYMGQWALACYLAPATRMNHGTRVSMTGSCTDIQIQPATILVTPVVSFDIAGAKQLGIFFFPTHWGTGNQRMFGFFGKTSGYTPKL